MSSKLPTNFSSIDNDIQMCDVDNTWIIDTRQFEVSTNFSQLFVSCVVAVHDVIQSLLLYCKETSVHNEIDGKDLYQNTVYVC